MEKPTLNDWLWVEVMLMQAMLGAISSNFRQISLSFKNKKWLLNVTIEKDDKEDRDEILEIADEFSIFIDDIKDKISSTLYVKVDAIIEVSSDSLKFTCDDDTRVIFRRKED